MLKNDKINLTLGIIGLIADVIGIITFVIPFQNTNNNKNSFGAGQFLLYEFLLYYFCFSITWVLVKRAYIQDNSIDIEKTITNCVLGLELVTLPLQILAFAYLFDLFQTLSSSGGTDMKVILAIFSSIFLQLILFFPIFLPINLLFKTVYPALKQDTIIQSIEKVEPYDIDKGYYKCYIFEYFNAPDNYKTVFGEIFYDTDVIEITEFLENKTYKYKLIRSSNFTSKNLNEGIIHESDLREVFGKL